MPHWLYAGQAFAGLPIAFRATQKDSLFEVFFSWKRIGQLDLRLLPEDKNSRLALCSKATDLRLEDSHNLPNANHSNLPRNNPSADILWGARALKQTQFLTLLNLQP